MTFDILYCKDDFIRATESNSYALMLFEQNEDHGLTEDYNNSKCMLQNDDGKFCRKKGFAIIKFKDIHGDGKMEMVNVIRFGRMIN